MLISKISRKIACLFSAVFLSGAGLADEPSIPFDAPLQSLMIRHIGEANARHITFELNQQADPGAHNNLVNNPEFTELVLEYKQRLLSHMQATDDPLTDNFAAYYQTTGQREEP